MTTDWREDYQNKLCSAADAAKLIKSGDSIYAAGFTAIPYDFTEALADRKDELENVDYYACLAPYLFKIMNGDYKGHINYNTIFSGAYERAKAAEGNINQMSVHLAESDRFIEERAKPNVMAVNVSPPDKRGWMTFGPGGGMVMLAAKNMADTIIVTVQETQPKAQGEYNMIHVNEVDAIIETEVPIANFPSAPPTEIETKIASHIAPLVDDGSTIQIGIGGVPGAVAYGLSHKKDLGIHTEMLTDAMYHLVKEGVVTGAKKNLHPGKIVYGFAAGSRELMEFLDDNPVCMIRPLSETIYAA